MNYSRIQKKYPGAFRCFEDWVVDVNDFPVTGVYILADTCTVMYDNNETAIGELFEIRDLYDFFDRHDLWCHVLPVYFEAEDGHWPPKKFQYEVHSDYLVLDIDFAVTRKEAEDRMFEAAFMELESILRENE